MDSDLSTDVDDIYSLIKQDTAVNQLIQKHLRSDVALINQMGGYIINSGGKRLRPVISLLSARAMGYEGAQHVHLATIIEFIHTATLLHDDVVDGSDMRRGNDTANALWGNPASVLVGDFLYSRAFEMMVDVGDMRVLSVLARATNTIAEGEVMQLINCQDPETTEQRYLNVIHCKTAKLFEASAQLGGIISQSNEHSIELLARYGMHLGTAFQLRDDVLDYSSTPEEIGKNIGDDLAEGKPTLPLIYAMRTGTPDQADIIRKAIEQDGKNNIDAVTKAIVATGAITYTNQIAQNEAKLAIEAVDQLPPSKYTDAMKVLANFSVLRNY
ncbi:MAG: octaprenyl diphosphate synthase [Gammaproteobacteria bacterium]|nr:octaprenyl diphosphate synthase [Gammaproteobacteria bacterium]